MAKRPIYYDTETTGIRPDKDRIVEIAAYDPVLNRTFVSLVNPQISIPKEAAAIHGITDEMVANQPNFAEVGKLFIEFCHDDVVLVAHNNDLFDSQFLKHESKRHQLAMPEWPQVDSLKWSRKYRSDLPRHSLQFLRQIYGIAENQAHRALDDVIVLYQVFSQMIDDLDFDTILQLLSTTAMGNSNQTVSHMPFGKHQGKPLDQVPKDYLIWLSESGALEKNENASLKKALDSLGVLESIRNL